MPSFVEGVFDIKVQSALVGVCDPNVWLGRGVGPGGKGDTPKVWIPMCEVVATPDCVCVWIGAVAFRAVWPVTVIDRFENRKQSIWTECCVSLASLDFSCIFILSLVCTTHVQQLTISAPRAARFCCFHSSDFCNH